LPEYTDARRASLELALYSQRRITKTSKNSNSQTHSLHGRAARADNALVKQVLDGKTPEARAEEMISGTKLKDPEARKELAKGGKAAIDASTDPMIVVGSFDRSEGSRTAQAL
jgi:hypothetical protein